MTPAMVIKLSIEWMLVSPLREHTLAALRGIFAHYAEVYAIDPAEYDSELRVAYMRLPDWQKGRAA